GLFLAELGPLGIARQMTLGPLSSEASDELLDLLFAEAPSDSLPLLSRDPALRERLLKRADGIPFFLVSCAQGVRSGALNTSPVDPMMAREARGTDSLPWDVAQSVRLRVSALPEAAQTLLGIAAVAGRVVLRADLVAVARQAGRELAEEDSALAG